jgi:thiol-disulfide isomerase/thioredoxin
MLRLSPLCVVVLFAFVGLATADEPKDEAPLNFAAEVAKLNAEYNAAISQSGRDATAYRKADDAYRAQLEKVVARAEKEKLQEHAGLAMAYQRLRKYDDAIREAKAAIADRANDLASHTVLISAYGFNGKPDEAEAAFNAALKALPNNPSLEQMRQSLAFAYQRAQKYDKAAEHLTIYIEKLAPQVTTNPNAAANFRNLVTSLTETAIRGKRAAETLPKVEKLVKQMREASAKNDKLAEVTGALRQAQVRLMAAAERKDEATKLIGDELAELEKSKTPDLDTIVAIGELKRLQLQLAGFGPERVAAVDAYYEYLNARWEMSKTSARFAALAADAATQKTLTLMYGEKLDEAEKLAGSWQDRLKTLKSDDAEIQNAVVGPLRDLGGIRSRLAGEIKRRALVGQPHFPILEATWLNGSPLKPEELRGKVVLLDFWAVWCGPCIATFPHLREWHDKYGDKGLVIIGVTRHYEYGWDAEAKRGKPQEGISKADEDKATTEFVKHHELKHRIAVMPDNELSAKYLVTGIPQAVLIDRDGAIRMIRVGSGEANAQMLERTIQQLLGTSEQAAK